MDPRRVRYFLAVVEHGTVTAASEHLRVAQPAVSRQISAMERQLGVRLFTRHGPRLALTQAGREFAKIGTDLIRRLDRAELAARQLSGGVISEISIAAASTTITEIVAPFAASLSPAHPFVTARPTLSEGVHQSVRDGTDVGIAATAPPTTGLAWRPIADVPLRAYTSARHRWALERRDRVSLEELLREPLVLPSATDPTRTVLDDAVRRESLRFREYRESASPLLRLAIAASDRGVGIATDLQRFGAHPVFVEDAAGEPVLLSIHACWDPAHYAAPAITEFVAELERFSRSSVQSAAWELSGDRENAAGDDPQAPSVPKTG